MDVEEGKVAAPNWALVTRKIKDLKPHPKNPRTLSTDEAAHLQISMDRFGLIEKIVINTDNQIIGGHQRYRLLKKNKVKEVDCWIPDRQLDEKEAEELLIRLNRNTGKWDWDGLANEFEGLELIEWGFKPEEMLGDAIDEDEKETSKQAKGEKEKGDKKLKVCPSCGHAF